LNKPVLFFFNSDGRKRLDSDIFRPTEGQNFWWRQKKIISKYLYSLFGGLACGHFRFLRVPCNTLEEAKLIKYPFLALFNGGRNLKNNIHVNFHYNFIEYYCVLDHRIYILHTYWGILENRSIIATCALRDR